MRDTPSDYRGLVNLGLGACYSGSRGSVAEGLVGASSESGFKVEIPVLIKKIWRGLQWSREGCAVYSNKSVDSGGQKGGHFERQKSPRV